MSSSAPPTTQQQPAEEISASRIHANPQKNAFRRWFSKIPPSLQLILLQMWMPTFMAIMFVLCYVGGFHHIAPHHVPVDVVGSPAAVAKYQDGVDKAMPGAWDFSVATSVDNAKDDVKTGKAAAAYIVKDNTIVIASAHQAQAAQMVPKYLEQVLQPESPVKTKDVAPLPPGDLGMTPMYLMLTWCISGYLAAMFIGLMGGPLRRLIRFAVIIGGGIVLTFLSSLLAGPVLGAIDAPFFKLWGLGACWAIAIGMAVNGLSYFCGRFIAVPSMLLFIFLSIPSSGAAMPKWFVGEPFAWLNHIVVGSGITEMLKRMVYDVGPGYTRGWIMMLSYLVIGVLLTVVGKPYWEWLRIRRMLKGTTTMFQDAQRASGKMHDAERKEILGRYGLEPGPDGMVIRKLPDQGKKARRGAVKSSTSTGNRTEPPAVTGPLFAVPAAQDMVDGARTPTSASAGSSTLTASDASHSVNASDRNGTAHTSDAPRDNRQDGVSQPDSFHDLPQDAFLFAGSLEQTFDAAGPADAESEIAPDTRPQDQSAHEPQAEPGNGPDPKSGQEFSAEPRRESDIGPAQEEPQTNSSQLSETEADKASRSDSGRRSDSEPSQESEIGAAQEPRPAREPRSDSTDNTRLINTFDPSAARPKDRRRGPRH